MKRLSKDEIYKSITSVIVSTERDLSRLYTKALERVITHTPKLLRSRLVKGEFVDVQKHPAFREAISREIEILSQQEQERIKKGLEEATDLANEHCNQELYSYLGDKAKKVPPHLMERYLGANLPAMSEFKKSGLTRISDRVWKDSERTLKHIELSIGDALAEGVSAEKLSRVIRDDLKEPYKLFRRVRDKYGALVLSKNAKEFHPGTGVYRSIYKNAMRLARTEINSAYRLADHERWQGMDFVVGIKIQLSNNHTLNGRPFYDICDELVGVYPKSFVFRGWHVQCRCIATSVLEDRDAFFNRVIDKGEPPKLITSLPKSFRDWEVQNRERVVRANARGTLPYFLRDNKNILSIRP